MPEHQEPSPLQLVADLEREAELLVEAAGAEGRHLVEVAREEADTTLRAARSELHLVERAAYEEELARARGQVEEIRAAWTVRRRALEDRLRARMDEAVRTIVDAVLAVDRDVEG